MERRQEAFPGKMAYQQVIDPLKMAIQQDNAGNYAFALEKYIECERLLQKALKDGLPQKLNDEVSTKIGNLQARIRELHPFLNAPPQPQEPPRQMPKRTKSVSNMQPQRLHVQRPVQTRPQQQNSNQPDTLQSAIMSQRPNIKFSDVAGLTAAKQSLYEAVIMPIKVPDMFKGPTVPWKGILLYGPPGTGKSFLAKAVAGEANQSTFLTVSTSDLTSKWVGESEKLIKSLFQTARQSKPSIVFIDEIDSLVGDRGEDNSTEAGRRMKTEFLIQMDGVGVDNTGIIIIAATNLPWAIDPAMRRRFEKRVYVPLPDKDARMALIVHNLKEASTDITKSDIKKIVAATEGFSGADITILIRDALMQPIRELQKATHFKKVKAKDTKGVERDGVWVACSPSARGSVAKRWDELPPEDLAQPIANMSHFNASLSKVRPSVSKADLKKYEQWTKKFGEDGS